MKKILIGVGSVVLLLVVAGVIGVTFLVANLGDLIKTGVEEYGPGITKTAVKLERAEVDATEGTGTLFGFTLGNPKGFDQPRALTFDQFSMKLDTGSLTGNPIIIERILINKPVVTYELGEKLANFDVIQRNVQRSLKELEERAKSVTGADEGGGQKKPATKIIIRDLLIQNGKVNAYLTGVKNKGLVAPLPKIHLKNIGGKSKGVSPERAAEQIVGAVLKTTKKAVAPLNLPALGGVGEAATRAAKDAAEKAGKKLEDIGKKTGDKIKGLFKD